MYNSLGGMSFGQTAEGNWGYIAPGADTVTPFSSGMPLILSASSNLISNVISYTNSSNEDYYCIFTISSWRGSSSGDTISLTGCEKLKTYYEYVGNYVLANYLLKIPSKSTFMSTCRYVPNERSGYSLIKIKGNNPPTLSASSNLVGNAVTFTNTSNENYDCIFSLFMLRGSATNVTLTLTGCEKYSSYYDYIGNFVTINYFIRIPAKSTFTSTCSVVPNYNSCYSLVKLN